jgi:hypothetical protein
MYMWDILTAGEREKLCLEIKDYIARRPEQGSYLYEQLWNYSKAYPVLLACSPEGLEGSMLLFDFIKQRNLWQFRSAQLEKVAASKRQETKEAAQKEESDDKERIKKLKTSLALHSANELVPQTEWRGTVTDSDITFQDGNMYWGGTVYMLMDLPKGGSAITVEAWGEKASGVYPYMIVDVDGEVVGETYVTGENRPYVFTIGKASGPALIGVTFANDAVDLAGKEDRNLYVGSLKVE